MTVGILVQGNLQDSNIEQHSDYLDHFTGIFFAKSTLMSIMAIKYFWMNNE